SVRAKSEKRSDFAQALARDQQWREIPNYQLRELLRIALPGQAARSVLARAEDQRLDGLHDEEDRDPQRRGIGFRRPPHQRAVQDLGATLLEMQHRSRLAAPRN